MADARDDHSHNSAAGWLLSEIVSERDKKGEILIYAAVPLNVCGKSFLYML